MDEVHSCNRVDLIDGCVIDMLSNVMPKDPLEKSLAKSLSSNEVLHDFHPNDDFIEI